MLLPDRVCSIVWTVGSISKITTKNMYSLNYHYVNLCIRYVLKQENKFHRISLIKRFKVFSNFFNFQFFLEFPILSKQWITYILSTIHILITIHIRDLQLNLASLICSVRLINYMNNSLLMKEEEEYLIFPSLLKIPKGTEIFQRTSNK